MYIYQIERALLWSQIASCAKYLTGDVLDIGGGGENRYRGLYTCKTFVSLDVDAGSDVDIVASADDIPLPDGSKDAIISTQVLEHVKYPEKCVQEMHRVLKKGGYAVITVPQWNELHDEPRDFWRYTKYGLAELFERNGFSVVEQKQRGGFFSTAGQMTIRYCMDRFALYRRPFWGKVFSRLFHAFGSLMIWLDTLDTGAANRKHAIGWCFVFQK
ncbi:MAG: class I SAM-dependent methyltransferase [Patescibacteria group bacterium]|nr:class I SAM-dependent methyltransferase [Patescibacteria group bacterium]